MNKICIIGTYYGEFPKYFPLWLKSCEYNPTIDFFVFTDNVVKQHPDNVKFFNLRLSEIKNRASAILGFPVSLERPYKLCDYKPLYGKLFEKEIKGYDYWGHCDFDLVFGDLQYFFDKYELRKYDRFGAFGHLSLYRNIDDVNEYYKLDGGRDNFMTVFTNDKNFCFDEFSGMTAILQKQKKSFFTKKIFADIDPIYDRYKITDILLFGTEAINYEQQVFYWENGKCYREFFDGKDLQREEYLYVHFQKRPNYELKFDCTDTVAFYITKFGFFEKNSDTTSEIIVKYNPFKGKLYEKCECYAFRIKCRLLGVKNKINRLVNGE